jgi:hypothetical protein
MKYFASLLLSLILLFLGLIHIYWGFGGKSGMVPTVPTKANNKPVIKPGAIDCLVVAIVLIAFAAFVLIKTGFILFRLPNRISDYGLWGIAGLFLLRAIGEFKYVGFFKKIKTTRFGLTDTKYYSPLCLLIGLLSIILELLN